MRIERVTNGRTGRVSSYDTTGGNRDWWVIPPGETQVLADIRGKGRITHIWMTQPGHYRECVLGMSWDGAPHPSVRCPLGDFFCLGHGIVNSFQSALFATSTSRNHLFNRNCALNCYAPMPFRERAVLSLTNESTEPHIVYFLVDYELDDRTDADSGYFHAEFRRENPFGGWAPEIEPNSPECDGVANKERDAWSNNYVILDTKGRGHYIGCNLSVTNFQGGWWGEGDDMIWVDGYHWPPDLHGTGSEDYLNQAYGMQPNAWMRSGSSIHESDTDGYQTSYVFHLENPVRFQKEIKVTIEHGHGNHLANEMSSVAYWYADRPTAAVEIPPVAQRAALPRSDKGWFADAVPKHTTRTVPVTPLMAEMKARWKARK